MILTYHISLAGQSHIKEGKGCQDFSVVEAIRDGWYLVAVADGVGSALCAEQGAQLAVNAVVHYCKSFFPCQCNERSLKNILIAAYNSAIRIINQYAENEGKQPEDYDTTLSCVLYNGRHLAYGHVGDGGIIGLLQSGEYISIANPQKADDGISVIPLRSGAQEWEFGFKKQCFSSVLLATDGMYESWFAPPILKFQKQHLYILGLKEFMDFNNFGDDIHNDDDLQKWAEDLLTNADKLGTVTTDDKTVAVIMNKELVPAEQKASYYQEPDWNFLKAKQNHYLYGENNEKIANETAEPICARNGDVSDGKPAILIAGAGGMLRRNLVSSLENNNSYDIYEWKVDFGQPCVVKKWSAIIYLLGEEHARRHWTILFEFLNDLKKTGNHCSIFIVKFGKADRSGLYSLWVNHMAKRRLKTFRRYMEGCSIIQFCYPRIFGKWCCLNENNIVAEYCARISAGNKTTIDKGSKRGKWVYVDDVISVLLNALNGIPIDIPVYCLSRNEWKEHIKLIHLYQQGKEKLPLKDREFLEKLYQTYMYYTPMNQLDCLLEYSLNEKSSVINLLKPNESGICRLEILNHKNDKSTLKESQGESVVVICGKASVSIRDRYGDKDGKYELSENLMKRLDIPDGYEYTIENAGMTSLVCLYFTMRQFI